MKKLICFILILCFGIVLSGCGPKYEISVPIEEQSIELKEGESKQINPVYTDGTSLSWSSNDEKIATVKDGKITALSVGNAKIKVWITDHEKVNVVIEVTVSMASVSEIKLEGFDIVYVGKSITLKETVLPETVKNKQLTWSSSDEKIATVKNGVVTGIGEGMVKITALASDGSDVSCSKQIEVRKVAVADIVVSAKDKMQIGASCEIQVTITPDDATHKEYTVKSSNPDVILVSGNTLTALKEGVAVVTVSSDDNPDVKKEVKITVTLPLAATLTLGEHKEEMYVGDKDTPVFSVLPDNAVKKIKLEATPEGIVSIDAGTITALQSGVVTIKASTVDGSNLQQEYTLNILAIPSPSVYIGDKKYDKLSDALKECKEGDTLLLEGNEDEKVYAGCFIIKQSGITLTLHPESKIPVKFKGTIDIEPGLKDIHFSKLGFVRGNIITLQDGGQENISFTECVFDGCTNDGTVLSWGNVKNIKFDKISVINNKGARFFYAKKDVENLDIIDSSFEGPATYDWVHFGLDKSNVSTIKGNVNILGNSFGRTQQSSFYIWYHGSGLNLNVKDNLFENPRATAFDIREAVDNNTPDAMQKTTMHFIHNRFVHTDQPKDSETIWGCIRLRFTGYTEDKLDIKVNYNAFIDWTDDSVVDNASADFKKPVVNMDHNYFSDITEVDNEKNFGGIAKSWEGLYASEADLEAAYQATLLDFDDNVLLVGKSDKYTKEKYPTLNAALDAAISGNVIYLLPGSHTGDVRIDKDDITITSLNGTINPNSTEEREEEATYEGIITLAPDLKNCVISGIKFIGASQIKNEKGAAGTASDTTVNLLGFTFKNNIVASELAKEAFIYTSESASSYSKDIVIKNNYFTKSGDFKADSMLKIDNCYDVVLAENVFENISAPKVVDFYDTTKGLSGQNVKIESNMFIDIKGNPLWINWLSSLPNGFADGTVAIENNSFRNIEKYNETDVVCIHVGKMNNGDQYKWINVRYNQFTNVEAGMEFQRVHANANINCNYNIFNDIPARFYIANLKDAASPSVLNAKDNLYLDGKTAITPDDAKFVNKDYIDAATTITCLDDIPAFNALATGIEIIAPDLYVGDEVDLKIKFTPANTAQKEIIWEVDDPSVAVIDQEGHLKCLKLGKVIVKAIYQPNSKVTATLEINLTEFKEVSLSFDNDGYLKVGESFKIDAVIKGANPTGKIVWTSSDPDVITVTDGLVKAVREGTATVGAEIEGEGIRATYTLTVKDINDMNKLLRLLVEGNNGCVWNQTIYYHGWEQGYENVPHNIFGSVNNYFAGNIPDVTENPLPSGAENNPNQDMVSLEFITVHDTGSATASSTAWANSHWCTNPSNTGTSWHYTIGNDGIFHQMEDTKVAWHAADGASWGTTTKFTDTGIKADPDLRKRPKVTIESGYFFLNGIKTNIPAPDGATEINETGFVVAVKDGTYQFPTVWRGKSYGRVACARGGNLNSIGIETAVNKGSDVYLTWQYVAKFVAKLLIKHDLTPERVHFHNSWCNKPCPQTMMRANKVETFLDMVYLEYYVLKDYSDYEITFTSHNPDIIDNSGRVIGHGPYKTTEVSYTITVKKGDKSESALCHCVVQGSNLH